MVPAPDEDNDPPAPLQVILGPDLNASKTPLDKKLYRQILLPNGLKAVLISDTVAMHQSPPMLYDDYDDEEDSHEEEEEEEDSDEEDEEEEEGLREAAAALVVGAGSFMDPPHAQGMAHFLEHMLFMGTKKYPQENAYDAFLSQHGGSDNAYTELEYTVYHFEVPQEELFKALDMFAQFFIHPLFREDAVERELNSIESEFQLSRNSDQCRLQQLWCHTCERNIDKHPFGKFSWGSLKSLKEAPQASGTNIMDELRTFYNQYYYAQNMKLVVVGAYPLDKLQKYVLEYFQDIPSLPRLSSPLQATHQDAGTWDEVYQTPLAQVGPPLHENSLGKVFYIAPVRDRHTVSMTWQIPTQVHNWKSKPCDFISHLIGHEAQGSLLSSLKAKSWAYDCYVGVGSGGHENASSHALFNATFTLSEEGISHWTQVIAEVYEYIGMLRHYCTTEDGLPEWIYEELRSIHEVSYHYGDEPSSDDLVEGIVEDMAPHQSLPTERLLDGSALLFEHDPSLIKNLLDRLTPRNARVDIMSSIYGRAADFDADEEGADPVETPDKVEENDEFNVKTAGPPEVEPYFGTRYWRRSIVENTLCDWESRSVPQLPPPESLLSLPPKNPYVPESYSLKALPADDGDHPLVHSSLKLCVTVGKKKSWFPATATKYNGIKNQILLSYEDEDEKWHVVDQEFSKLKKEALAPGYEGTLDSRSIKYRVVALATDGKGPQMKYGDDSDDHVGDGAQFPPIPPALSESRLPQLISNTQVLKFWHLQDRTFKRPIAELRLNMVCAAANRTPLHHACADLLVRLIDDALTETCYLASMCELGTSFESTETGFIVRVHGFDDKLFDLFQLVLGAFLSFRGQYSLPDIIKDGRFEACLEQLRRIYSNAGLKAGKLCGNVRVECLKPTSRSSHSKAKALENINVATFCNTISELLAKMGVEGIYYGNVSRSDAESARDVTMKMLQRAEGTGLPRKKYPNEFVLKIPLSTMCHNIVVPSKDAKEPNTAVQVYFQVGKDNAEERVLIDLLSHMMYEPLYDQIRTKDQFGYEVSCDARWTDGVMGLYFRVVTATKSAAETVERIDQFLRDYYKELKEMSPEDFLVEVVGLAKNKLDMHDSLADACNDLWSEIRDRRYAFEAQREEVLALRKVTQAQVLEKYRQWLLPQQENGMGKKRRMLVVQVIGTSEGAASIGRPTVEEDTLMAHVDETVSNIRKRMGNQTWGKIY